MDLNRSQLSPIQINRLKRASETLPFILENPQAMPLAREVLNLREEFEALKLEVHSETYQQSLDAFGKQLAGLENRIANLKLQKGDKGDSIVGPRGFPGPKGDKGDTTIVEKVIEIQKTEIIKEQPIVTEITKEVAVPVIDTAEDIRNKLELLTGDERLDKSAIKGLEQLEKDIVAKTKSPGIGGVPGLLTYVGGTKKGFLKAVNFKAGTGVTLTHSQVNGLDTITFASTVTGFSKLTPTGTVNGTNKTFVFTSAPTIVVVDQGVTMQKTSSDGTVNWTGTTTIILSVAPNFDVYGF